MQPVTVNHFLASGMFDLNICFALTEYNCVVFVDHRAGTDKLAAVSFRADVDVRAGFLSLSMFFSGDYNGVTGSSEG